MMDPMAALGLVSNVVQIVGFTASLVSETREFLVSSSDALPRNDWVESLAQSNNALAEDLEKAMSASGVPNKTEAAVRSLAKRCQKEAAVLIGLLEPLKVKAKPDGSKPMLKALTKALRSKLRTHEIEASQKKLESLERQLCALLLRHIQQSQAAEFEELKHAVERNGRDCIQTVLGCKKDLLDIINRLRALQTTVEQGFTTMEREFQRMDLSFRSAEERKLADSIVSSLAFEGMKDRHRAIETHRPRTFEWMFSDTDSQYQKWLQTQSSIFWVCGEAGSGKSTLMRYLREEPESRFLLQKWAANRRLLIADHYFWVPGSSLQKSLEGMLRTLLHQLLKDQSELLLTACPARWTHTMGSGHRINDPWTHTELIDAITKLGTNGNLAICFFIDGLDECEERSHPKLNQLLRQLSNLPNVKICMSSRPWTAFKWEFESNTETILLHELNLRDIFEYVCDRLYEAAPTAFPKTICDDDLFSIVRYRDREERLNGRELYIPPSLEESAAKILIYTTVLKAQGVFLWASIVMDGICTRLVHQSAAEVLPYLDDFPLDLESHFEKQIFARIDATYRKSGYSDTAMNLMLALYHASSKRNTILFWHLRHDIAWKTGAVKDERFAEGLDFQFFNRNDFARDVVILKRYLAECCKDLLHVVNAAEGYTDYYFRPDDSWSEASKVDFRHRAAYDFLATAHMQEILQKHVPAHFKSPGFWHQFHLVKVKRLPESQDTCSYLIEDAFNLFVGLISDPQSGRNAQQYNDALHSYFSTFCPHGNQCSAFAAHEQVWFLSKAFALAGRYSLIMRALRLQPWISCYSLYGGGFREQFAMLTYACGLDPWKDAWRDVRGPGTIGSTNLDFVMLMLDSGFSPHSTWSGDSFWHRLLDTYQRVDDSDAIDADVRFDLFKTNIEHGADLCPSCREKLYALLPSRHHAKLDSLIQEYSQPEKQRAIADARLKRIANYPAKALTSSEWSEVCKRGWRNVVDSYDDKEGPYQSFLRRAGERCHVLLCEDLPEAERGSWMSPLTRKRGKGNPEKTLPTHGQNRRARKKSQRIGNVYQPDAQVQSGSKGLRSWFGLSWTNVCGMECKAASLSSRAIIGSEIHTIACHHSARGTPDSLKQPGRKTRSTNFMKSIIDSALTQSAMTSV